MVFSNPSRPHLHLPRHLHIARWVAIGVFLPLAFLMAIVSVLLWQLSRGPVDVTLPSRFFQPVAIASGPRADHPAGRLLWSRLAITWQPASQGIPSGLVLAARGLKILRLDGTVADQAARAETVLSLSALIHGVLSPRTLRLENASFTLRRAPDGDIDFDLPSQQRHGRGMPVRVNRLTALDFRDVTFQVAGLPHKQVVQVGPVEAHLRVFPLYRHGRDLLWTGSGHIPVRSGGIQATVNVQAVQKGRASDWSMDTTSFTLSDLGPYIPALTRFSVPIMARAELNVPASGRVPDIRNLHLVVQAGAGRIGQPTAPPLMIRSGQLEISVRTALSGLNGLAHIEVRNVGLALVDRLSAPTQVRASGGFDVNDLWHIRDLEGDVETTLDKLDFATAETIWPENLMRGARRWVTRNVTQGRAQALTLRAQLHTQDGLSGLYPTTIHGTLDAHDMTVSWLRPINPVTNVDAHMSFDGPNAVIVDLRHGQEEDGQGGNIFLSEGQIRINGILDKDQDAVITTDLHGSLPSFLTLLSHPRLHLLSRHPLPFTEPSGDVSVRTRLMLPLTMNLRNNDIHLLSQARFENVHLGSVLLGRSIDDTSGTLTASEKGLSLEGDGMLSGIRSHAAVRENFEDGAPDRVIQDITCTAAIDPDSASKAQIGPAGMFAGHALLSAHYVQRADASGDLGLKLDMEQAALTLPIWTKPLGEAAQASVHLGFAGHDITTLDALQAHGSTLDIAGRAVVQDGAVRSILLEGFRIGRSEGNARIDLPTGPAQPIGVNVDAALLDLAPLFVPETSEEGHRNKQEDNKLPSGAWIIDVHGRQIFYGPKGKVGNVTSHVEIRDGKILSGHLTADAPTHVAATLDTVGNQHPFRADIKDLGALLTGLGLYDRISGGEAHLKGEFAADTKKHEGSGLGGGLPPFNGTLEVGHFAFLNPPGAVTAVSLLSPLQWPSNRRDRFEVLRLSVPMKLASRILTLHDVMMGNAALGATVQGPVDLDTAAVNLRGTIIPLFGLNALPGHLPVIGHMFAPERGGGMLAATFTVHGTVEKPTMTINPLSMLLPGALRNIFR